MAALVILLAAGIVVLFALLSSAAQRRTEVRRMADSLRRGTLLHAEEPYDVDGGIAVPFLLGGRKRPSSFGTRRLADAPAT